MCYLVKISHNSNISCLPQPQIHFAWSQIQHKRQEQLPESGVLQSWHRECGSGLWRNLQCHDSKTCRGADSLPPQPAWFSWAAERGMQQGISDGIHQHSLLSSPFHLCLPVLTHSQQQCCKSHPPKAGLTSPTRKRWNRASSGLPSVSTRGFGVALRWVTDWDEKVFVLFKAKWGEAGMPCQLPSWAALKIPTLSLAFM